MSIQTWCRCGVSLFLVAVVAGCSSGGSGSKSAAGDDCKWLRSRCLYEGSYDRGERDYAEQEAKRLNAAESQRLMRNWGQ